MVLQKKLYLRRISWIFGYTLRRETNVFVQGDFKHRAEWIINEKLRLFRQKFIYGFIGEV